MNIIKEILGLFRRNTIVTPEDSDVLIVGKRKPGNSKTPQVNDALVTFKSIKDSIGVDATNIGVGEEVLQTPVVNNSLKFRTLRAGSNITITQNADDIQIDAAGGSSSGILGISDATGTYTYYNDINSATNAASAGDTVEFFSNITETDTVSWALKAGVNYNMNGYTYTLDEPTGTNVLDTSGIITNTEVHFWNGRIKRRGSSAIGGNTTNIVLSTGTDMTIYFNDCILESDNGKVLKLSGTTKIIGGTYISQWAGGTTTGMGTIDLSAGTGSVTDATILSKGALAIRGFGSCRFFNCNIYSQNYIAVQSYNAGLELHNCSVHSDGSEAVSGSNGIYINTKASSTASDGFSVGGKLIGCTGYSSTSAGMRIPYTGMQCLGLKAYSKSSYAFYVASGTNAILNGCFGKSDASAACFFGGSIASGCTFEGGTTASSHAIIPYSGSKVSIFGCTLVVNNTSANGIGALIAVNSAYGNNSFLGNPTIPVNASITQQQVTVADSFGNIVAD